MEAAITFQWERIEASIEKHIGSQPLVFSTEPPGPSLNPGASEADIVAAETALGLRFPEDLRASLKRHNGQAVSENRTLIGMGPLLSTQEIVFEWTHWKEMLDNDYFDDDDSEPDPGVQASWWNARWIPITHDGGGDHDCVDMDPAEGGSAGQVIEMWHDDGARPLVAPSFEAWLTALANDLEGGALVWGEDGFTRTNTLPQPSSTCKVR